LLSQAIPTQRFTVITLPWKRLFRIPTCINTYY
jgi:hypothetical protein